MMYVIIKYLRYDFKNQLILQLNFFPSNHASSHGYGHDLGIKNNQWQKLNGKNIGMVVAWVWLP